MQNQTLEARVARLERTNEVLTKEVARLAADVAWMRKVTEAQEPATENVIGLMNIIEVELKKANVEMKRNNESLAAKDALLLAQAERIAGQSEALAGRAEKPRKKGN